MKSYILKINIGHCLIFSVLLLFSCKQETNSNSPILSPAQEAANAADPLPSWNEGNARNIIMDFVEAATTEGGPGFIPEEDRIATFDNDGTLWAEKPVYFQLLFAIDRVKTMAPDHPEWKTEEPYRAILENDMESLKDQGMKGIATLVMTTHAGMSPEEFQKIVQEWMSVAQHPETGKPFDQMVYQPMLELLNYLRANKFRTFIVSGGGLEFLRSWAEVTYSVPPYQVVGSSIKTEFVQENGRYMIKRLPEIEFIDDKEGKPVAINRFIGKVPTIAVGNSDGDLPMLLYSATKQPSLQLYVHHTDSIREWAYDRKSHVGQLDKGLDTAAVRQWTLIDMANDWNRVFPE
ncbi:haloacid dehalogenase-like hydrolase [Robertkochia marina]|uniref:phosphoserine phosphatase n=1 Tax=Robertkochia marina TaxID=1227945 RepID=A0A4S3LZ92_9FLAO|nr:HAD family hydrolase [Robertkochia marina]THD65673.1 haloacid dehalogenase-like hydrolase [Robertkochia marina]TRZ46645.1 haloacid dehalogenase-like hydrolase [Robertkochia marina]